MTLDASIYGQLGTKPMSIGDYDEQGQRIQQNMLNMQTTRQALDVKAQDQAEKQGLRNLLSGQTLDLSNPADQGKLYSAAPTLAPGMLKTFQDSQTSKALAAKDNAQAGDYTATTAQKQYDLHRTMVTHGLQSMLSSATSDQARQAVNDGVSQGYWSMQEAQQKLAAIPSDPQQYSQWRLQQLSALVSAKDQLDVSKPTQGTRNTGNTIQNTSTDPFSGAVTVNATTPLQATPGEVLSAQTSRANNTANIGKDYTLAGLDANGKDAGGGTGGLSPAAIENAATRYNVDGTLPPQLGRGTQGARDMRAIQNRAAELSMGTDPTQLRVNQLDAKGATSALAQLTKSQTMAASFENTANQNADLALSLSKKNDRTGIPMINAGLQAWRTGTGSPEATQFAAANETFVNEYAKIMSGGLGNAATSDSASRHAHELLSVGMTDGQYEGNVRLLQQEMRNRMKGYDDQTTAVKARIGGKGAVAAPAPAAGVPDDIVAILAKHGGK